jgi:hypothetical protein
MDNEAGKKIATAAYPATKSPEFRAIFFASFRRAREDTCGEAVPVLPQTLRMV